jgi:hypothetical protein
MQSRVSELEVTSKADQNKVTQSPHTHKTSTLSESSLSVSNKPMTVQTNLNELLHRKMYDEAFVHVLKQNDEFHFVKLISKLSSKSSNFYDLFCRFRDRQAFRADSNSSAEKSFEDHTKWRISRFSFAVPLENSPNEELSVFVAVSDGFSIVETDPSK